ncbi:hypothetical protein JTE90_011416 [Oedothorax gibbosus]|uniref:Uncharacterized protein n=1 Tax=Oedothorax gibbosus TaxID=931172 RepID=A0AAV6TR67_9ARAC|nr:hypothetical protein JTE90_011416 [Oedothorax gibbosus]
MKSLVILGGLLLLQFNEIQAGVLPFFFPSNVKEGDKVLVTCTASGEISTMNRKWLKDGLKIEENNRVKIFHHSEYSSLIINSVLAEDSGNYTCTVSGDPTAPSYTAELVIQGPPVWLSKPTNIDTVVGKNDTFECSASGRPNPTITWKKNGDGKSNDENVISNGKFIIKNGKLTIVHVQKEDEGKYTCMVTNGVGPTLEENAFLYVLMFCCVIFSTKCNEGIPQIQPFFFPDALSVGQKTSVSCTLNKGSQPVSFRWLKDGTQLLNINNVKIMNVSDVVLLTINPVIQNSSGNYTCIASNTFGKDEYTAMLLVKAPPKWISKLSDTSTYLGSRFETQCKVTGRPVPLISWFKQDSQGNFNKLSSNPGMNISNDGTLTINNVNENDEGKYRCKASNDVEEELIGDFFLTVYVPARFEEKFKVESVRQGDSAVLRCDVTGDQPISIVWFKDKRELEITEASRYEKFETFQKNGVNSELFIRNVDRRDGALYSCTATNDYGSDERNIKVLVVEVPAQPLDVKVLDVWARSASIRWSAPYTGNSAITKYKVQYWRDKRKFKASEYEIMKFVY